MSNSNTQNRFRLDRDGKKEVVRGTLRFFFHLALLLLAAGRSDWFNAWAYIGFYLLLHAVYVIAMLKADPQLLNERGRFMQANTKAFDKVFYALYIPLFFITLIVAGLDAGRHAGARLPFGASIAGMLIALPTFLFVLWAMLVNTHFEATVRIQEERGHQVCTSGPYKIVRHPGYVGMIILAFANPLILGSRWAFAPGGIIALLVLARTMLEDRTLQDELPGYKEYAENTRYRLLPGVW